MTPLGGLMVKVSDLQLNDCGFKSISVTNIPIRPSETGGFYPNHVTQGLGTMAFLPGFEFGNTCQNRINNNKDAAVSIFLF
jgi:hypothetical protein